MCAWAIKKMYKMWSNIVKFKGSPMTKSLFLQQIANRQQDDHVPCTLVHKNCRLQIVKFSKHFQVAA